MMRVLLVNNHCITDPTAGVTQSLRTLMEWLADAGHACHILTTSRFEAPVPFTIQDHLRSRGVLNDGAIIHDHTGRVPISLIMTAHTDEHQPFRRESEQYVRRADRLLQMFQPDLVMACNGHPMIRTVLEHAKQKSIATVCALRGYGYERQHFTHVDHVFTCSRFLSEHYRTTIGLKSTPIAPPIAWADVVTDATHPLSVTFVHPAMHKGWMVFLRLADMLHTRRPDIPLLVVESSRSAARFGLEQMPWIQRMAPTATPAGWLACTRLLLVPSVWNEPFGRVAAEAMINGIPVIVSDRGGLPEAVGEGGVALPLPAWLTVDRFQLPTETEMDVWMQTICRWWDDAFLYQMASETARLTAETHYSETVSKHAHLAFIEQAVSAPAVV